MPVDPIVHGAATFPMNGRLSTPPMRASNDPAPSGFARVKATIRGGGLRYSLLYLMRRACQGFLNWVDRRLVRIEQRRCLTQPWTISARRFTAADNKNLWNTYDWSRLGEEWTKSDEWKQQVVTEWLLPHFSEGKTF